MPRMTAARLSRSSNGGRSRSSSQDRARGQAATGQNAPQGFGSGVLVAEAALTPALPDTRGVLTQFGVAR